MASADPGSRYARQPTIAVIAPDGTVRVLGAPRVVPAPPARGAYTVRPGDRLDLLAHVAAGDSTRWWLLADANPYRDATALEQPGQSIELPDA
jgi:nucleoid-associated protein YgaU